MHLRTVAAQLVLFAVLLLVAIGGSAQSQAFAEKDVSVFFSGLPLWEAWIFLTLPIAPFMGLQSEVLFWGVQVVWFYVLAVAVVQTATFIRRRTRRIR